MIFAPHKLFIKQACSGLDENGDPIQSSNSWGEVGPCRCDDNITHHNISVNGEAFTYAYKIVYEGEKVEPGAVVRVTDGERVRAEGRVVQSAECNYFNQLQIWI